MVNYSFTYADLEYFLLIFARITSFIYIVPFFSMNNTPLRFKVGLGIFLSILMFQTVTPHETVSYATLLEYTAIVLKEAVTGFIIGFGVQMCYTIVSFAGRIMDMEIGLSMVSLLDPTTRESTSITGIIYQYMVTMILLISGLYEYLMKALADTFRLIPVNGAIFRAEHLYTTVSRFMSEYIIIGFRICLPVFAVMIILNAVLGVLAKVSPQLNMFAVGIQIKVLVGLSVLILTASMLPGAADFIYTQMKKIVVTFVEGMM